MEISNKELNKVCNIDCQTLKQTQSQDHQYFILLNLKVSQNL